jgi:pimeloyl-ACP methyl ester carboxylesterase
MLGRVPPRPEVQPAEVPARMATPGVPAGRTPARRVPASRVASSASVLRHCGGEETDHAQQNRKALRRPHEGSNSRGHGLTTPGNVGSVYSSDQRSTGKSTGDWREAGISELADDVLAAVRFLRQRDGMDPDQIGIEGDSEGGWIVPAVAIRDPRIKFIAIWAGPAMDYVPELMNEVEENLKASGLSGDDLRKALEFKRQAFAMLADGAGLSDEAWAKFQAFVGPYRNGNWFSYVGEPEQRGWPQKKLYLMAPIKPSERWRRVKIPVLALYGGEDLNVPAAKNVTALTRS